MHVSAFPYSVPKIGNSSEEYEDAYWPSDTVDSECEFVRFAVADGASETSYSGVWGRLLVEAYCKGELYGSAMAESLYHLRATWKGTVGARPLPWYAEEKIRSGAFSSLIGLTLQESRLPLGAIGTWVATAIGDSCLFQVSDDELITHFPLFHSEQFNRGPTLLSTDASSNEFLSRHVLNLAGEWKAGDTFYLMTDALACWFLKEVEDGEKPWKIKRATQEMFEAWIAKLRQDGVMRNDDVTMFRIEPC
jgi:hypothetical protein